MFMYYVDLFVLSAVVFRVFNAFFVFKKNVSCTFNYWLCGCVLWVLTVLYWSIQLSHSVYGRRSCAKSVENSSHHSDTQSTKANSSGGLQADFNNAGPFAISRKVRRANVHLPSVTTAISRALLWRPVRLPADRFNNCRGHSSATHCTHDVIYCCGQFTYLNCRLMCLGCLGGFVLAVRNKFHKMLNV